MNVKLMLDEGAHSPTYAHTTDAGMDLYAAGDTSKAYLVPAHGSMKFDTGVHILIPEGYVGFLKSKSGLNVKKSIVSEGVIDAGYTGSIVVKLYNHGDENIYFYGGEKITQLVILPVEHAEFEVVDSFEETARGANGFGSSGK